MARVPRSVGVDWFIQSAQSAAHHLMSTGAEELVYLSGGERLAEETADFPRLGKRKTYKDMEKEMMDIPVRQK